MEPKASCHKEVQSQRLEGGAQEEKKRSLQKLGKHWSGKSKLWSTKTKGGEGKIDKRERSAIQLGDHGQRQFGKLGPRAKQEERDKNEQRNKKSH